MPNASLIKPAKGPTNGVPAPGYGHLEYLSSGVYQFVGDDGFAYTLAPTAPHTPGGRLTLTSGTPVPTGDVTGAGTIYYSPYLHGSIRLYDGTSWRGFTIPEIALPLTLTSGKNYDVFAFFASQAPQSTNTSTDVLTFAAAHGWSTGAVAWAAQSGGGLTQATEYFVNAASSTTITLHSTLAGAVAGTGKVDLTASVTATITAVSLGLSAAWSSDSARADALARQNGLWVKSGAPTYFWLGTLRASGTNTTEDSKGKRFVWNAYNQASRPLLRIESTNNWSYATDSYRYANNDSGNIVQFVVGSAAYIYGMAVLLTQPQSGGGHGGTAIGLDGTTNAADVYADVTSASSANVVPAQAIYQSYVPAGYHFLAWLERAAGTTTFYGDDGATRAQSGLTGEVSG